MKSFRAYWPILGCLILIVACLTGYLPEPGHAQVGSDKADKTAPASPFPRFDSDTIGRGANTTWINYVKSFDGSPVSSVEEIPENLWADEIHDLKPLYVYAHGVNIVVVTRLIDGREEGIYVSLAISSFRGPDYQEFDSIHICYGPGCQIAAFRRDGALNRFSIEEESGLCKNNQLVEAEETRKSMCRWKVASHPEARLAHGRISFIESNGEVAIKEHVGGGSSRSPLDESLELILRPQVKGDYLHFQMIRHWNDRESNIGSKTRYPKGSSMHVREFLPFTGLTTEWQILWRADFEKESEIVKSVAYLARLSPMAEQYDGFGRQEMVKVKAVLSKQSK